MSATAAIPTWLTEHCLRLQDQGSNIRNLNLNIRRLNVSMMEALSKAVLKSTRIETINLTSSLTSHNSNQTILPFLPVLANHTSLRIVHLSYNRLQTATAIGETLSKNNNLIELHLDYNQLDTDTALALANGLKRNETLRVLQLNSNRIGDKGGQALALALRTNKTLHKIGLHQNQLGFLTQKALLYALNENVTLSSLHIDKNPDISSSCDFLLYLVRANKAGRYLLKSDKDVMRSVWPLVLERISDDADILFFFLREKPDLVTSCCFK